MQKKIIALAVAGLVSGAAFAQSNVTIFGIVDMAFVHQGSHTLPNVDSYNALDDGGWDSSRFGFKGTEDLGNGLSANFYQEFDLNIDESNSTKVGSKNSWVSLAGKNWGEIKLGSFGTVHDDYAGWSESGGMAWGNGVVDLIVSGDAKNAAEYISPSFNGLQFKLGTSTNYVNTADDSGVAYNAVTDVYTVTEQNNLRAYFGSAAYANGGLKVALTFDKADEQNTDGGKSEWLVAGGYDFGMFKVGAGYDRTKFDDGADSDVRKAYRLTVGAPVGANGAVALSYSNFKWDDSDLEGSGWGLSYAHALSKRTSLYASAYSADLDDAPYEGYENGIKFGVRHLF